MTTTQRMAALLLGLLLLTAGATTGTAVDPCTAAHEACAAACGGGEDATRRQHVTARLRHERSHMGEAEGTELLETHERVVQLESFLAMERSLAMHTKACHASCADAERACRQSASSSLLEEDEECADDCDNKVKPVVVDKKPTEEETGGKEEEDENGAIKLPSPPTASPLDLPGIESGTNALNSQLRKDEARSLMLDKHISRKEAELTRTDEWIANAKTTKGDLDKAIAMVKQTIADTSKALKDMQGERKTLKSKMRADELQVELSAAKLALTRLNQQAGGVSMIKAKLSEHGTDMKKKIDHLKARLSRAVDQFHIIAGVPKPPKTPEA